MLNDVLGTKFKLVTGYLGSQETILAIERGEAHGRCMFSHSALKIAKPDWLRDKKVNMLVQYALTASPELPGVPLMSDGSEMLPIAWKARPEATMVITITTAPT